MNVGDEINNIKEKDDNEEHKSNIKVEDSTLDKRDFDDKDDLQSSKDTNSKQEIEHESNECTKDCDGSEAKSTEEAATSDSVSNTALNSNKEDSLESKKSPEITKQVELSVENNDNQEEESVSEAIEEPVMLVTGEGNGADCESSYIIGEEIEEEVMYFFGEGSGYDNDTGNPEALKQENADEHTDGENGNEECVNGEHCLDVTSLSNKTKLTKGVKLKTSLPSVTKRTLKKQSNDTVEVLTSDSKKHCVRNIDKSDSSNSINCAENTVTEEIVRDKSATDSESPRKSNAKKGRSKVKKKRNLVTKIKLENKVLNSVSEKDNGHDNKVSIIEKRKSSISSEEQDEHEHTENEKDTPDKDVKVEDPLPPKKLRLETTPESDVSASHSKETTDNTNHTESHEEAKSTEKTNNIENSISLRKKVRANKDKLKRKKVLQNKGENDTVLNKTNEKNVNIDKKENKSLKRSLLDATISDKNKSESQSDSEEDELVTSGKRLKIKPKKIITSTR